MIGFPSIAGAPAGIATAVSPALARAGAAASSTTNPAALLPVNIGLPFLVGIAQEGQSLTVSTGVWLNSPSSYSYQWNRNGVPIAGSINSTRILTASDIGAVMSCAVTASNANGLATAVTLSTSLVIVASIPVPSITTAPTISGTLTVGQTLSTTAGVWSGSPTSYAYQWRRDGVNIDGATSQTYLLMQADAYRQITVRVTATNAGGTTPIVTSSVSISPVLNNNLRAGQMMEFGAYTYNTGESAGHLPALETYVGAPLDFRLSFLDGKVWSDTVYKSNNLGPNDRRLVYGVPLAWDNQSLTVAASGSIDNQFAFMANTMLNRETTSKIDVRLGWEMNGGTGYAWGKGNNGSTPELYVAVFRRVVALMRALPGGDRFRFWWNINGGVSGDPSAYYPGDDVVDAWATDIYQNISFAGQTGPQSDYNNMIGIGATPAAGTASWMAAQAAARGKLFGVPEWGFNSDTFASQMKQFIDFLYAKNSVLNGLWDSNQAFAGQVSAGQYPALSSLVPAGFGLPGLSSPTALTTGDATALQTTLVPSHPVVSLAIVAGVGNDTIFTLNGTKLTMAAQAYSGSGSNDRTVTIRATDNRGLTKDTVITVSVQQVPAWVLAGAIVDHDYKGVAGGRFWGAPLSDYTSTHTATTDVPTSTGNNGTFAANVPRITDKGLYEDTNGRDIVLSGAIPSALSQDEFTIVLEGTTAAGEYGYASLFGIGIDGSTVNGFTALQRAPGYRSGVEARINSADAGSISAVAAGSAGMRRRVAVRINRVTKEMAFSSEGAAVQKVTLTSVPTGTSLALGSNMTNAKPLLGPIARMAIFGAGRTDAQLVTLSTLS